MAGFLMCPQGHRWLAASDGVPAAAACPTCGAAGRPLVDADSAVLPTIAEAPPGPLAAAPTEVNVPGPVEAAAPAGDTATAPPVLAGYEILGELGRGGMGVVYRARQKSLKREVALKVLRAGSDAEPHELARFKAEAEAVARLHHPNFVQIHEIAEHDGRPCLCLELVEGGGLDARLQGKPMPPEQAAELVATLARAMHTAHQRGIVHRDLKPANILLSADGTPKITDFGLAKRLDRASLHTQSGSILGTPNYMAPEQAGGSSKNIGPAADVYSLGAILYELLTGRPPFKGEHLLDTLDQLRWQAPVPPRRLHPQVPRDLEAICLKCLEKERTRRYATAEALAEDLGRFLRGERTTARWGRAARVNRLAARVVGTPRLLGGVPGLLVRGGALTLVCCLLSGLAAWSSSPALIEKFGLQTWPITARLEYEPLRLHGQRIGYAPASLDTVMNQLRDRATFDQLIENRKLRGLDASLLGNHIFSIAQVSASGDSRLISIATEWDDPAEGVEVVDEFLKICLEHQRRRRIDLLKGMYDIQEQVVEGWNREVEKARKALTQFLNTQGTRDAAAVQLDLQYYSGLVRELDGTVRLNQSVLEGVKDRIELMKERIVRLKEAKGAGDAGDEVLKERRQRLDDRIRDQENVLGKAHAAVTQAKKEHEVADLLYKAGAGTPKGVQDAAGRLKLAVEDVKDIEQQIMVLKERRADLKPGSSMLQLLQSDLSTLELEQEASGRALHRSRQEQLVARERVAVLTELSTGAKPLQAAIDDRVRAHAEASAALMDLAALRNNNNFELLVVDPPRARSPRPTRGGHLVSVAVFAACMTVLLPVIFAYGRLRSRSGRRPYSPAPGA
jgi:hypothetical protein